MTRSRNANASFIWTEMKAVVPEPAQELHLYRDWPLRESENPPAA